MAAESDRARFDEVQARIDALRASRAPKRQFAAEKFNSAALAWRMVTELVVGVLLGAAIGWAIDTTVATKPLFLIIFGLLGFAAGIRTVMRSAGEVQRREQARLRDTVTPPGRSPTADKASPGAEHRG